MIPQEEKLIRCVTNAFGNSAYKMKTTTTTTTQQQQQLTTGQATSSKMGDFMKVAIANCKCKWQLIKSKRGQL